MWKTICSEPYEWVSFIGDRQSGGEEAYTIFTIVDTEDNVM